MTRQALLRSSPGKRRTRPLLSGKAPTEMTGTSAETTRQMGRRGKNATTKSKRFGEMAGGTTAECAAICCCCPCSMMNLLVLAFIKFPASLCRKVKKRQRGLRNNKKKMIQQSLLEPPNCGGSREELEREVREAVEKGGVGEDNEDGETEAVELEKQMWDRFYGAGFWRSPSQRET